MLTQQSPRHRHVAVVRRRLHAERRRQRVVHVHVLDGRHRDALLERRTGGDENPAHRRTDGS